MNSSIPSSRTTLPLPTLISQSPPWRGFPTIIFALGLAWFGLPPLAHAVSPAPDGGYSNANTAEGDGALGSLTSGFGNTAIGFDALFSNTTGNGNSALGYGGLFKNIGGSSNSATGYQALFSNTAGSNNTADGAFALQINTTGNANTAIGEGTLFNNTTGNNNTATGTDALGSNTSGSNNAANGSAALSNNTTGLNNTGLGVNALFGNTSGQGNTAVGFNALKSNTTAFNNTATGQASLSKNTTGTLNTANGWGALVNNTTGSSNIALGAKAGTNLTIGSNNIDIGNVGVAGEASKIRLGTTGAQTATFIAGIRGVTVASGLGVVVSSSGQLGTVTSSARFKDDIKPMDKASEAILALHPVTFRYKHELDPDGTPQFGLVAEQVEKVDPDLVVRDEDGKVNTVRYEAVNAMLLNEFLKEHKKVEEQQATITQINTVIATQEATIAELKSTIAQEQTSFRAATVHQEEQIKALTVGLQKVGTRLEVNKPVPQRMAENQ